MSHKFTTHKPRKLSRCWYFVVTCQRKWTFRRLYLLTNDNMSILSTNKKNMLQFETTEHLISDNTIHLLRNFRQFHNIYTIGALEGPSSSALTTITAAVSGVLPTTAQTGTPLGTSTPHHQQQQQQHHHHQSQYSHMTQKQICHSFLNLTDEQRRICSSNAKIMEIISVGARLGREECQHQFRNSRWNCTAPVNSTSLYGSVTSIREWRKLDF